MGVPDTSLMENNGLLEDLNQELDAVKKEVESLAAKSEEPKKEGE